MIFLLNGKPWEWIRSSLFCNNSLALKKLSLPLIYKLHFAFLFFLFENLKIHLFVDKTNAANEHPNVPELQTLIKVFLKHNFQSLLLVFN